MLTVLYILMGMVLFYLLFTLFLAEGATHSESSLAPGYGDAVKSIIDQYLDE